MSNARGRRAPAWAISVAVALVIVRGVAQAQFVYQNFDLWPASTGGWSNYTYNGWVLTDGQVSGSRGGPGPVQGIQSAWLNDADAAGEPALTSPPLSGGVDQVSFESRSGYTGSGNQILALQVSTNGQDWVGVAVFDRIDAAWRPQVVDLRNPDVRQLRFLKLADFGDGVVLGLDEIRITPAPGVLLDGLLHRPASPTVSALVHIEATARVAATTSNLVMNAHYRLGVSGAFLTLPMAWVGGTTYRTLSPIPSGHTGTVQYYVACAFEGHGISPVHLPTGGGTAPLSYRTDNPYLSARLRSLNPSSHAGGLILSELHYHPPDNPGGAALEFVELFNTEPVRHDLGGYRLDGDIAFTFPTGTVLAARSFLVVARDPAAFATQYGTGGVYGPFTGSLPNEGGHVRLRSRFGTVLAEVDYDDDSPWPLTPDGAGHSLVLARPDYGEADVRAWCASRFRGGSPGSADPITNDTLDGVVLNEFLAHTDLPEVDYVELYNAGATAAALGGCSLSDTTEVIKYTFAAGTTLAPGAFRVLTQAQLGFSLSSHGDDLYFTAPGGARVIDAVRFPAQRNGKPEGRRPDGGPRWAPLQARSPGASNASTPLLDEGIVINEIHFHPLSGLDSGEFIELYNTNAVGIDLGGWRLDGGVRFTFPDGVQIAPTGFVVVAKDAAALRALDSVLTEVNTVGDYDGQLSDRGERLVLLRPDEPTVPGEDFVVVDDVTYGDGEEWGTWIDGEGSSLELTDPRADNRWPMHWMGSDESQKAGWTSVSYTGSVDNGYGPISQLRIMHLGAGECLVDQVVVRQPGGPIYLNENFEGGVGAWTLWGNHSRSGAANEGYTSGQSLQVRASGGGNEGAWSGWSEAFLNHARVGLSGSPVVGSTVAIDARVRWLAGWPHLTLALQGFWMAADVAMEVPAVGGTPGRRNSRHRANGFPALGEVEHRPVLPAAGEAVVVSVPVDDPDGVGEVRLYTRIDPAGYAAPLVMSDDGTGGDVRAGDGLYSATIPGQNAGTRVVFYISARDRFGAGPSRFPLGSPVGAPAREGVLRWGEPAPVGVLGDYRMWMTAASEAHWLGISGGKFSNEPIAVTFVLGADRVVHGAGARWRGLWRTYESPVNSGAYALEFPGDARVLGDNEIKIDQPGQNASDGTRQTEACAFWIGREIGLPSPYARFVRMHVNGTDRGIMHDLQVPSLDFCRSWFDDEDPLVFKQPGYENEPFGRYRDAEGRPKKSVYRWNLRKRRTRVPDDDYATVYAYADAAAEVDNRVYEARVSALLDVRSWSGFFAVNSALAGWDHYGWSYCHNGYVYLPRHRGGSMFLYDMDHVMSGSVELFPITKWPVAHRMYTRPIFRRPFYAILQDLLDGPLQESAYTAWLDGWHHAFLAAGAGVSDPGGIKSWLAGARGTLQGHLNGVATTFAVTSNGGADFSADAPVVTLTGTAPVTASELRINGLPQRVTWTDERSWSAQVGLAGGANALRFSGHDWQGGEIGADNITVTLSTPAPDPGTDVLISEIMYHPPEGGVEYLELHNRSALSRFDLRGWRLDGVDLTFPGGTVLEPGGYAVVTENATLYQQVYSNAEVVVAVYPGNLDNAGERLHLRAPDGANGWRTVDDVVYDDAFPWPVAADGLGSSLQVRDIWQDNARPGNWLAVGETAEPRWRSFSVTGVVQTLRPVILDGAEVTLYLDAAATVRVDQVALVTGFVAEAGANLLVNGGGEDGRLTPWEARGNHGGSAWRGLEPYAGTGCLAVAASGPGAAPGHALAQRRALGALGGMPVTLSLRYFETAAPARLHAAVSFTTLAGAMALAPPPLLPSPPTPGAHNSVAAVLPTLPPLWLNEVMPHNVATVADGTGAFEPWVELFHAGTGVIDLAGCALSDTADDLLRWRVPADTRLGPGGRLLIWLDGQPEQTRPGELHASLGPPTGGGTLFLSVEADGEAVLLDALRYEPLDADQSWGAYPEGGPDGRQIFHLPTPGEANNPASLPVRVVINEWMAANVSTIKDPDDGKAEDWFELYNPTPVTVHLGGYYLTDDLAQTNRFRIPGGVRVPAGGHLLVWSDDDADQFDGEVPHANFKLEKNGEAIGLFRPDGALVDRVVFGPQTADVSEGRWPDGAAVPVPMTIPTPGAPNRVLQVAGVPAAEPDGFRLDWHARSGTVYRVLATTNLAEGGWQLSAITTARAPLASYLDTNALPRVRFYRIEDGR